MKVINFNDSQNWKRPLKMIQLHSSNQFLNIDQEYPSLNPNWKNHWPDFTYLPGEHRITSGPFPWEPEG